MMARNTKGGLYGGGGGCDECMQSRGLPHSGVFGGKAKGSSDFLSADDLLRTAYAILAADRWSAVPRAGLG
ncbi:hypothetical protein CLOSS21_00228 [Clostridium sp. SS2/1]|nr:hypothetical protein CLOSS21_00228 [Clostridium sp. SS2/1]